MISNSLGNSRDLQEVSAYDDISNFEASTNRDFNFHFERDVINNKANYVIPIV
jgi:hypothetical protein